MSAGEGHPGAADAAAQLAALRSDRAALADREQDWAMVVAGAVLGVALAGLSRRWGRSWVAELRGES